MSMTQTAALLETWRSAERAAEHARLAADAAEKAAAAAKKVLDEALQLQTSAETASATARDNFNNREGS